MKVMSFETGLEHISFQDRNRDDAFPVKRSLPSIGEPIPSYLEDLFKSITFDQHLESFIKPEIEHGDILSPSLFNSQLNFVKKHIESITTNNTEDIRIINDSIELLDEYSDNSKLLSLYRNLLLQA